MLLQETLPIWILPLKIYSSVRRGDTAVGSVTGEVEAGSLEPLMSTSTTY